MIRKAEEKDITAIERIFEGARRAMAAMGNTTQWVNGYPGRDDILRDMADGVCRVMEDGNGRVYGVFSVFTQPDPTYPGIYDGAWLNERPYATIHRIASDYSHRGVLKEAVDYCLELTGEVRIDTHRNNLPMINGLTRLGFTLCGKIRLFRGGDNERLAFQKSSETD